MHGGKRYTVRSGKRKQAGNQAARLGVCTKHRVAHANGETGEARCRHGSRSRMAVASRMAMFVLQEKSEPGIALMMNGLADDVPA